jgi:hypothetical protein
MRSRSEWERDEFLAEDRHLLRGIQPDADVVAANLQHGDAKFADVNALFRLTGQD